MSSLDQPTEVNHAPVQSPATAPSALDVTTTQSPQTASGALFTAPLQGPLTASSTVTDATTQMPQTPPTAVFDLQDPRTPEGHPMREPSLKHNLTRIRDQLAGEEQHETKGDAAMAEAQASHESADEAADEANPSSGSLSLKRPLSTDSSTFQPRHPPMALDELAHRFKTLIGRQSEVWTPQFGIGLPLDQIGSLNERNSSFVAERKITEKIRNDMQGQLLTGVMASRRSLVKYTDSMRNVIHHLAPIGFTEPAIILEFQAGDAFWSKSVGQARSETRVPVYAGDEYDRKAEDEGRRSKSVEKITLSMRASDPWPNLPGRPKLIRIGDGIVHFDDKVALFRKCFDTLQRGGFLELQFFEPIVRNNHDGDVAAENPLNMLFQLLCEDAPEDLRDFSGAAQARIALQEAGFDDQEIEISRSRAFIGPHAHGTGHDRAAASLCRETLRRYMRHIGEISLLGARGMMAGEVRALRHHVWEMLDSQAGRFHLRFVCIVARKAERA